MLRKDYKARVLLVAVGFLIVFVIVLIRLFLLQVCQKDFFKVLAKHQYYVDITIDHSRAVIKDRHQALLVCNRDMPSAFILPRQLNNKKKTKKFLKKYYPDVYKKITEHKDRHFLWLERKLSPERYAFLQKQCSCNTLDIEFLYESQRFYPYPVLAPIIGLTDIDNNGISGVELAYTKRLKGVATDVSIKKDARSKNLYFEKNIKKQGHSGKPVTLTIDTTLQLLAHEELKETVDSFNAESGAVLILNPDNGEILTMANYPVTQTTENSIVTECYEPGSVIKIFLALAALEEDVVKYDEIIDNEGKVGYVNGFRVENWKYLEELPFYDTIRRSSNVGVAKVAQRLGAKYYDNLVKLGFGKKTGISFPGEREGFVNSPKNWSRSSLTVMSFGYEIMTSILQLGVAMSIIANGGYSVKPVLVKEPDQKFFTSRKLYKDQTICEIKNILERPSSKSLFPGYRVMGKTGTARMVKEGEYSRKNHVYSYAGIVEKDTYRRVIVTFIKEPECSYLWASQVTAPLFQKIAERMILHDM